MRCNMCCFIGFLIFMVNCAHHKDVRPGTRGVHKVVVTSESQEQAQRNALDQANHFCDKRFEQAAAVQKEKTEYVGDMDEEDYKMGKTASRVLQVGGATAWALGGRRESNAGMVATGAGTMVGAALGKGYRTKMIFQCI